MKEDNSVAKVQWIISATETTNYSRSNPSPFCSEFADTIKWAWLLYLMDVFYVDYVTIGSPPPTSLVYYIPYLVSWTNITNNNIIISSDKNIGKQTV